VPSENLERSGGANSGNVGPVDHEFEDRRLSAASRIEPAMLVGLARSSRPRLVSPSPELSKVASWSPGETADNVGLCPRRVDDSDQQSVVFAPVRQEGRPLRAWATDEDVVRRGRLNRRGEYEHRCDSADKTHRASHDSITPPRHRAFQRPVCTRRVAGTGHLDEIRGESLCSQATRLGIRERG
jgi:hypothetical protein